MSARNFTKLPQYMCLVFAMALSSCENSNNNLDPQLFNTDDGDTSNLHAITNYIQLFGSVSPFDSVSIKTPFTTPTIEIIFTNVESNETHKQIAVSEGSGSYVFLIAPVSTTNAEFYDVSSSEISFGQLSILPLVQKNTGYMPGEYALGAMNNLVIGYRDIIQASKLKSQDAGEFYNDQNQQYFDALDESVERFQNLIAKTDDSVVFSSPISDPNTGEVLLDYQSLALIDSIYAKLSDNYAVNSFFLDGNPTQSEMESDIVLSFNQINTAVMSRFSAMEGIRALASITLLLEPAESTASTNFLINNAISIVKASLLPAIASNFVAGNNKAESKMYLQDVINIIDDVENSSGLPSGRLFTDSFIALKVLTELN